MEFSPLSAWLVPSSGKPGCWDYKMGPVQFGPIDGSDLACGAFRKPSRNKLVDIKYLVFLMYDTGPLYLHLLVPFHNQYEISCLPLLLIVWEYWGLTRQSCSEAQRKWIGNGKVEELFLIYDIRIFLLNLHLLGQHITNRKHSLLLILHVHVDVCP